MACASVDPPNGGPTDVTPPKVVSSNPDSAQTNFRGNTIEIEFDEYVKTKNIQNLLIISPSLGQTPKTEIKKKSLIISFPNDTLQSNTTYTVLLNGCIEDNNEGNPIKNYQLFFSTGETIDSLEYEAVLINAFTKEACENCLLALYTTQNDSAPLIQNPVYLARSNVQGRAKISHLRAASFRAIGISDENSNLKINDDERISLYKSVEIVDSQKVDTFYLFPYINSKDISAKISRSYPGVLKLGFNKSIESTNLKLSINDSLYDYSFNLNRDSLTSYIDVSKSDTFAVKLIIDSIIQELRYTPKYSTKPHKLSAKFINSSQISLQTKHKIRSYRDEAIKIYRDSLEIEASSFKIQNNALLITLKKPIENGIKIKTDSNAITDWNNDISARDSFSLFPSKSETSNLKVEFKFQTQSQYMVQLLSNEKVIRQDTLSSDTVLNYSSLTTSKYRIRIIKDENRNFMWDSGDFLLNKEAEELYLSESVELRQNWDKELIIKY